MTDEARLTATAKRISARWGTGPRNNTLSGGELTRPAQGVSTYTGASVTNTSSDFIGDWRAADSWMRFDLYRVRNRSRSLQRGNNMCRNFGRTMCHFVLGSRGFHMKVNALTMKSLGDSKDGQQDAGANAEILRMMNDFGQAKYFDSRKRLTRRMFDRLLVWKLIFDGEVIIQKRRGFANDYRFAWQMIDPDYLDHNLNRIEDGRDHNGKQVAAPGNLTKMGVELDRFERFPVAYWFLVRRPNDYAYNYATVSAERYIRVPAEEVIHLFAQDDDSEQTRGWPWIFAGMLNLYRADKFQEAALINATIGASKPFFYTKDYPTGFEGNPNELDDDGFMIDRVAPGVSVELPYGVKPVDVNTRYPDAELAVFLQAMSLGMGLTFGTSYATTTGDLSQANFVSSKLGIEAENALFHATQELIIEGWKVPGFDEELYRAMLANKLALPVSKFEKFNQPIFTGHRRSGIQPLEEAKADTENLNNRITSISAIIEKKGLNRDEVFAQIAQDETDLEALKIQRITGLPPAAVEDGPETEPPKKPEPAKK